MKSDTQYALEIFEDAKKILKERGATYSGNQNKTAKILAILFSDSVPITTVDNIERYKLISHIVEKLSRYCVNFYKGGHPDSAIDGANYFFLLAGTDHRIIDEYAKRTND